MSRVWFLLLLLVLLPLLQARRDDGQHHQLAIMPHILKNPDGTVNMDAMKKETDFLKG